jgi:hypothetical protein
VESVNSVKTILAQKITEAEPALDILGSDRKVLQVACQDFANYFRFNWKVGEEERECDVNNIMEQFSKNEPIEFESFLTVWIGIWLKKWKARVKLLFGNQKQNCSKEISKPSENVETIWEKLDCKREMMDIVVSSLIRKSEICGTEILAENLLKKEIGKINSQEINDKQLLIVLNNTLSKAREMAHKVGPLIYVKIDQAYFGQ